MRRMLGLLLVLSLSLGIWGCFGTQGTKVRVVPPPVTLAPVPTVVQMTEPKEPGYFQQKLLTYFGN